MFVGEGRGWQCVCPRCLGRAHLYRTQIGTTAG